LIVVPNHFNGRKFSSFDPIHKLPRSILFDNFVDFVVKEFTFSSSDYPFEYFPVFKMLRLSVFIKIPVIIVVPPGFGPFHDVNFFGMLEQHTINVIYNLLNYQF